MPGPWPLLNYGGGVGRGGSGTAAQGGAAGGEALTAALLGGDGGGRGGGGGGGGGREAGGAAGGRAPQRGWAAALFGGVRRGGGSRGGGAAASPVAAGGGGGAEQHATWDGNHRHDNNSTPAGSKGNAASARRHADTSVSANLDHVDITGVVFDADGASPESPLAQADEGRVSTWRRVVSGLRPPHRPAVPPTSPRGAYLLFALAALHVACGSGAAYGWTAVLPLLREARVATDAQLTTVGSLGIAANALCKYPVGLLLDHGGPRATAVVGGVMLSAGALAMAVATSAAGLGVGYVLIGVSGPLVQLPSIQFAELFGARKQHAIAVLVACFELSTGVFWLFARLHAAAGIGVRALFGGYVCVGAAVAASAWALWPDTPHTQPPPEPLPLENTNAHVRAPPPSPPQREDRRRSMPLRRQLRTKECVYAACFFVTHVLRQGVMLASMTPQAEATFTNGNKARAVANAFAFMLPLGFAPMMLTTAMGLTGHMLRRSNIAYLLVNLLSMAYNLLLLSSRTGAWLVSFALFPLARQLVFSCVFAHLTSVFGHRTFGRLQGIISTLAGLVQVALQTPLIHAAERAHEPRKAWAAINLLMGLLPLALLVKPVWSALRRRARRLAAAEVESGADLADKDGSAVALLSMDDMLTSEDATSDDDSDGAVAPRSTHIKKLLVMLGGVEHGDFEDDPRSILPDPRREQLGHQWLGPPPVSQAPDVANDATGRRLMRRALSANEFDSLTARLEARL